MGDSAKSNYAKAQASIMVDIIFANIAPGETEADYNLTLLYGKLLNTIYMTTKPQLMKNAEERFLMDGDFWPAWVREKMELEENWLRVERVGFMSAGNDILQLMPDIAAIGFEQLQAYCNEWLQRPIAKEFGVVQLVLTRELVLQVLLDKDHAAMIDGNAYVPIDELVGFIIDEHFTDPARRQELHAQWRGVRDEFGEQGRQYEALAGRVGTLYIKCKNPRCNALLETTQKAIEGTKLNCPPTPLTCPECGQSGVYDGRDLQLIFED